MTTLLMQLAEQVGIKLKQRGLMLTAAESCTGGGLSYWITSIPGSSAWFDRGFVTYTNEAKIEMLDVNPQTIAHFGAVSEQTAREMAEGALQRSHAHISIAITGIAGPAGGTAQKPVGTVWIAFAQQGVPTQAQENIFPGDRQAVREKTITVVLNKLLELATQ
ncbi:MAG: CinA family protein [Gammaproteobacteria bacterium]|nr:MAG: CinA family protein [Gammaproteobacteria bacterium]